MCVPLGRVSESYRYGYACMCISAHACHFKMCLCVQIRRLRPRACTFSSQGVHLCSVLSREWWWRRRRRRAGGRLLAQWEAPDVGLLSWQAWAPLGVCMPTTTSLTEQQPLLWSGFGVWTENRAREREILDHKNEKNKKGEEQEGMAGKGNKRETVS